MSSCSGEEALLIGHYSNSDEKIFISYTKPLCIVVFIYVQIQRASNQTCSFVGFAASANSVAWALFSTEGDVQPAVFHGGRSEHITHPRLGFPNKKEHVAEGENEIAREHKPVVEVDDRGDQRCEGRNQKTPNPPGSGGHGHTFELESQWVCFTHNIVLTIGPGGGEEEVRETGDENMASPVGLCVLGPNLRLGYANSH